MSQERLTARESLELVLRQVGGTDSILRDQIAEAMDVGKVLRERVSPRKKSKRVEQPSKRVALSEAEALKAAMQVFHATFLELPAVLAAVDTEVRRHPTVDVKLRPLVPPALVEIEVKGEQQITEDTDETQTVKPPPANQLAEMTELMANLQRLLLEAE